MSNGVGQDLPTCGEWTTGFLGFLSAVGAALGGAGALFGASWWGKALSGVTVSGLNLLGKLFPSLELPGFFTAGAVNVTPSIWTVALTAALAVSYAAVTKAVCLSSTPAGAFACSAGVANEVVAPDTSIFDMMHGRVDLVVKRQYWDLVGNNAPPFLWCAGCTNCPSGIKTEPPSDGTNCSPILRCYYRSAAVVAASIGTAIGVVAGATGGAIVGTILGIAAMSALSCSAFTIFAWICWVAVGVAMLIALACVGVAALLGGLLGNGIGAAAGSSGPPGSPGPAIVTGAYMSAFGNLVQACDANGANALWFTGWVTNSQGNVIDITQQTASGTALMGASTGNSPFCFTDPDQNIQGHPCANAEMEANNALQTLGQGSLP
jgi:hypothetical protein